MAHFIVMGLVQKSSIDHYWSTCNLTKTHFFGENVSCNHFQNILWNLHLPENISNPPFACFGHDSLHKMRNIISTAEDNFKNDYNPSKEVHLDESTCHFKG